MTMAEMLNRMSSVELSQRIALNNIEVREAKKAHDKQARIAKARRR